MPPFRAVCFDLGGVLIRIHHDWGGAVLAAGATVEGDPGPLGGFPEFDLYQNGDVGLESYLSALSAHLRIGVDDAMRVHMAVLREEYPGVSDLVESLDEVGIACGCLSNTNAPHWETFFDGSRYRFGPRLRVRVASHIVRASKPRAAIYAAFEAECGVLPSETVYFDDSPANVASALNRGWTAHLIDPSGDTASQMRSALNWP